FETGLMQFIADHGLPTTSVLVSVGERVKVFSNVAAVLEKLAPEQRASSIYVGFCPAFTDT
ncbi:MAG: hypothetical protein ABI945_11165, partial [Nitrospirales bacterium]